ncbi:serine/threonine-protein kinase [Thermoactinospora rubra]|uniref:serine/threonine-protein kinase n=1 Tax=Thermoactinospora rubra TaxID=1088767 RepID=UPI000A101213|nr:serine/threonine-protein kinase [Thermoactinospora rubra]
MVEPLRPGDPSWVGEYSLTGRLGEGGQGTVYLAEAKDGTKVALKLLRADLAGDREASERFVREVSLARRVAPFCTAQVIETGLFSERPYIVSEYVPGPTLAEVVRTQGPRMGASLHRLAIGTVTALVAIHQAGIVHRDFKPSNVVLAADGPRVIDFGIARALDLTSSLTGAAIGTPSFMAPEQLHEGVPGPPSDMFAWACTILYAASGQAPFGTDSLAAVFNRIMTSEPDLSHVEDPALRSLVADCLAKEPARRPTASQALLRLLGHSGAAPAPAPGLLAQGTAAAQAPPYLPAGPGSGPQAQPHPPAAHGSGPQPHPAAPHGSGPQSHLPVAHGSGPQSHPPTPHGSDPQPPAVHSHAPQPQAPPYPPTGPAGYGPARHPAPAPPYRPPGPAYGGIPPTRPAQRRPVGWIVVSAVAAVVILVAVVFVAVRLSRPSDGGAAQQTPTPTAGTTTPTTPTPTPTPTPSPTPTVAAEGTPIRLPGSAVTIRENEGDAIKLTSYSLDGSAKLYVRQPDTRTFRLNPRYFEYVLSPDGTRALATDVDYTSDGYAQVSVVEHRTGTRRAIKLSKAPVYPTQPRWSPDGRRGLVTLFRALDNGSVEYGYGILDLDAGTGRVFRVAEKGAGEWRFFWADDATVATWVGGRMKFYDLAGHAVRTHPAAGSPVWVEGQDVSPSGEYFLAHCDSSGNTLCAQPVSGGGEPITVPFASTRLIGWWDDAHIAGWVARGGAYEAVVVDLTGDVKRVLATASKPAEFAKMGFRFSRGTP